MLPAARRDMLGVGDGAESALRATSTSPAPFFDSPFLNLPGALADDAALLDFGMPQGANAQPQVGAPLPPQPAAAMPSAFDATFAAAGPAVMTMQPNDVLMAPFLSTDADHMDQVHL